jgi:hypothetical protein
MSKKLYLPLILFILFSGYGCISAAPPASELRQVSIGMTKSEIVAAMGEPTVARGGVRNRYGQVIEVWEYTLALPSQDTAGQIVGKSVFTFFTLGIGAKEFTTEKKNYWLYFYDSKLVQWGEAGDWRTEPERIYEFNFNPEPIVRQ